MNFSDLIKVRYSVRAYKHDEVPEELLQQVLEAARLAPTASNRQPFQVIVIHTRGREAELRRVYTRPWFTDAPLVLAIVGVPAEGWTRMDGKSYTDVDVAIVFDHIVLAATDLGLGTCWVGAFNPAAAREVLCLPRGIEPIAFTPLGYPADELRPKERRPIDELVRYERW
jgi:nitroreductase